jgi:prepilin-type N-terminal cleavage/methylation domain-containing protein
MSLRKALLRCVPKNGFTLIELLVSIGVMAIIIGITMSGGPQSIMRLSLSDNTYQVELMIREAQLQGSAINSVNNTYGGAGVYFNSATTTQTLQFKDRTIYNPSRAINIGDGLYESFPIDEMQTIFKTTNSNTIGKLCVATSSLDLLYCDGNNAPPIKTLTISFTRPKQTAHIYVNDSTTTDYAVACIQVNSYMSPAQGFVKSIFVYKSGMITKKFSVCQ